MNDMCPCGFPANDPTSTHVSWHKYWEYKQSFDRRARQEREERFEQHIRTQPADPAAEQQTLL